jgi:hypothetical protein
MDEWMDMRYDSQSRVNGQSIIHCLHNWLTSPNGMDAANCPESMEGKYLNIGWENYLEKDWVKCQMQLDDGKLPEANGERLIHFVQDCACDKLRKK